MKKYKVGLLSLLAFTVSCEEPYYRQPEWKALNVIAVEATLTNENTNHVVKLTKPASQLNGNYEPITGAVVRLVEGTNTIYPLTEFPAGSGLYYTDKIRAVFGRLYTLYIRHNGKEYFAQDGSVPVDPLRPFVYEKAGLPDPVYRIPETESGNDPNYVSYSISWEQTPACMPGSICKGLLIHYDLKNLDVNEEYKPLQKGFTFPAGSVVIRRKYSVSEGYKNFLRSMLSETEWRGGVFDVERSNVPTNLTNGAIGYFAVTTVVSDTTVVTELP